MWTYFLEREKCKKQCASILLYEKIEKHIKDINTNGLSHVETVVLMSRVDK